MGRVREEFEVWLIGNGNLVMKEVDGNYSFQHTRLAWEAWRSSRSALCVELPDSWIGGELGDDADLLATVDVKYMLEQAGVPYK